MEPKCAGKVMDQWAHARWVALQFIRPGNSIKNVLRESVNGELRAEYLNAV